MTILDIILAYKLEGNTNYFIPILGEKVIAILWDLLVWPDGILRHHFYKYGVILTSFI